MFVYINSQRVDVMQDWLYQLILQHQSFKNKSQIKDVISSLTQASAQKSWQGFASSALKQSFSGSYQVVLPISYMGKRLEVRTLNFPGVSNNLNQMSFVEMYSGLLRRFLTLIKNNSIQPVSISNPDYFYEFTRRAHIQTSALNSVTRVRQKIDAEDRSESALQLQANSQALFNKLASLRSQALGQAGVTDKLQEVEALTQEQALTALTNFFQQNNLELRTYSLLHMKWFILIALEEILEAKNSSVDYNQFLESLYSPEFISELKAKVAEINQRYANNPDAIFNWQGDVGESVAVSTISTTETGRARFPLPIKNLDIDLNSFLRANSIFKVYARYLRENPEFLDELCKVTALGRVRPYLEQFIGVFKDISLALENFKQGKGLSLGGSLEGSLADSSANLHLLKSLQAQGVNLAELNFGEVVAIAKEQWLTQQLTSSAYPPGSSLNPHNATSQAQEVSDARVATNDPVVDVHQIPNHYSHTGFTTIHTHDRTGADSDFAVATFKDDFTWVDLADACEWLVVNFQDAELVQDAQLLDKIFLFQQLAVKSRHLLDRLARFELLEQEIRSNKGASHIVSERTFRLDNIEIAKLILNVDFKLTGTLSAEDTQVDEIFIYQNDITNASDLKVLQKIAKLFDINIFLISQNPTPHYWLGNYRQGNSEIYRLRQRNHLFEGQIVTPSEQPLLATALEQISQVSLNADLNSASEDKNLRTETPNTSTLNTETASTATASTSIASMQNSSSSLEIPVYTNNNLLTFWGKAYEKTYRILGEFSELECVNSYVNFYDPAQVLTNYAHNIIETKELQDDVASAVDSYKQALESAEQEEFVAVRKKQQKELETSLRSHLQEYKDKLLPVPSLLQQLKQSILDYEDIKPDQQYFYVAQGDKSIAIHNATSVKRELEYVYNYIFQTLASNPHLKASDFVVVAKDLQEYLPFIPQVFTNSKQYKDFNNEYRSLKAESSSSGTTLNISKDFQGLGTKIETAPEQDDKDNKYLPSSASEGSSNSASQLSSVQILTNPEAEIDFTNNSDRFIDEVGKTAIPYWVLNHNSTLEPSYQIFEQLLHLDGDRLSIIDFQKWLELPYVKSFYQIKDEDFYNFLAILDKHKTSEFLNANHAQVQREYLDYQNQLEEYLEEQVNELKQSLGFVELGQFNHNQKLADKLGADAVYLASNNQLLENEEQGKNVENLGDTEEEVTANPISAQTNEFIELIQSGIFPKLLSGEISIAQANQQTSKPRRGRKKAEEEVQTDETTTLIASEDTNNPLTSEAEAMNSVLVDHLKVRWDYNSWEHLFWRATLASTFAQGEAVGSNLKSANAWAVAGSETMLELISRIQAAWIDLRAYSALINLKHQLQDWISFSDRVVAKYVDVKSFKEDRNLLDKVIKRIRIQIRFSRCEELEVDNYVFSNIFNEAYNDQGLNRDVERGVVFANLKDIGTTEHQVTIMLGLNQGSFPSAPVRSEVDITSAMRKPNVSIDAGEQELQQFLNLILNAGQQILFTYVGYSLDKGKLISAAKPLEQLRAFISNHSQSIFPPGLTPLDWSLSGVWEELVRILSKSGLFSNVQISNFTKLAELSDWYAREKPDFWTQLQTQAQTNQTLQTKVQDFKQQLGSITGLEMQLTPEVEGAFVELLQLEALLHSLTADFNQQNYSQGTGFSFNLENYQLSAIEQSIVSELIELGKPVEFLALEELSTQQSAEDLNTEQQAAQQASQQTEQQAAQQVANQGIEALLTADSETSAELAEFKLGGDAKLDLRYKPMRNAESAGVDPNLQSLLLDSDKNFFSSWLEVQQQPLPEPEGKEHQLALYLKLMFATVKQAEKLFTYVDESELYANPNTEVISIKPKDLGDFFDNAHKIYQQRYNLETYEPKTKTSVDLEVKGKDALTHFVSRWLDKDGANKDILGSLMHRTLSGDNNIPAADKAAEYGADLLKTVQEFASKDIPEFEKRRKIHDKRVLVYFGQEYAEVAKLFSELVRFFYEADACKDLLVELYQYMKEQGREALDKEANQQLIAQLVAKHLKLSEAELAQASLITANNASTDADSNQKPEFPESNYGVHFFKQLFEYGMLTMDRLESGIRSLVEFLAKADVILLSIQILREFHHLDMQQLLAKLKTKPRFNRAILIEELGIDVLNSGYSKFFKLEVPIKVREDLKTEDPESRFKLLFPKALELGSKHNYLHKPMVSYIAGLLVDKQLNTQDDVIKVNKFEDNRIKNFPAVCFEVYGLKEPEEESAIETYFANSNEEAEATSETSVTDVNNLEDSIQPITKDIEQNRIKLQNATLITTETSQSSVVDDDINEVQISWEFAPTTVSNWFAKEVKLTAKGTVAVKRIPIVEYKGMLADMVARYFVGQDLYNSDTVSALAAGSSMVSKYVTSLKTVKDAIIDEFHKYLTRTADLSNYIIDSQGNVIEDTAKSSSKSSSSTNKNSRSKKKTEGN